MKPCRDQSGNMRHIYEQICPNLFCDIRKYIKTYLPWVGRRACDDHLRLTFPGNPSDLVIIQESLIIYIIWHKMIQKPRHINRRTVGEMPAVRQVHPHHRIFRLQQCLIDRIVGIRPGMRLYAGMVAAKQFLHSLDRQLFQDIHMFAASVITLRRISFRIFIRRNRTHRQHHRRAYDILRSNQLQVPSLPV